MGREKGTGPRFIEGDVPEGKGLVDRRTRKDSTKKSNLLPLGRGSQSGMFPRGRITWGEKKPEEEGAVPEDGLVSNLSTDRKIERHAATGGSCENQQTKKRGIIK